MRPIFIALIIIFAITSTFATNVEIVCEYKPSQPVWPVLGTTTTFTTCEMQTDLKSSDVIIGANGNGTPNTDVKVFVVNGKKITQIPDGLKATFTNLVGIKIDGTNFKLLDGEKLKGIGGLKYLAITGSDISVIFTDTFEGNNALELIDLSGNPIFYIGSLLLTDQAGTTLKHLYLEIGCLIGTTPLTADDPEAVKALKGKVIEKCKDATRLEISLFSTTNEYIAALATSENCETGNEEECPTDCEEETKEIQGNLKSVLDKLAKCDNLTLELNDDIDKLNEKIDELEAQTCDSSNGTCSYKTLSSTYTCVAQKISVKTAAEQTVSWTGTHASGKNNAAVVSMVIQGQTVEILPLNIGTVFTNLKSLAVKNSGLTKIKAGDFKTLTKLETLEITGNKITTIDATAFTGLTALVKIDLSSNNIAAVPAKLFDTLSALRIINLNENKFTQVRYDVINSANSIAEVYLKNNAIVPLDRTFIWRLQKANKIDLSETGCEHSFDRAATPVVTFMTFYTNVVLDC